MCSKIPYTTKEEALKDAKILRTANKHFNKRSKVKKDGKKLRPYYCRFCNNWHLTSQKIRNKKGAKE